ncbi:MAG: hypothetical protein HFH41_13295 [Lachnospiraceae bacterium]|nr:hypothetical protein [Lachnospiraceae bacterium]
MNYWKRIGIGCAAVSMLMVFAACSGNGTEGAPKMTPEVTESVSPTPEVTPNATPDSTPQQNGQHQGNAGSQGSQIQGEKMTVVFIGRADTATIEIMADEQVKTAKLDAGLQKKFSALNLQDNQTIEITYEMIDGQILVKDITK